MKLQTNSKAFYVSSKIYTSIMCLAQLTHPKNWKMLTHDRKVVGSILVSTNILDGNGVKAMPGSIPAPDSGSL